MPCAHTAYDMRDGGLFCRTCGKSSTEVYYEAKASERVTLVDSAGNPVDWTHQAANTVYGYAAIRPYSFIEYATDRELPVRMGDGRWVAPVADKRKPNPFWVYATIASVAAACTGGGLFMHLVPALSAGVAGFAYLGVLALIDFNVGPFAISQTAREEVKALRSPPKAERRTGAIPTYGFGGRDLRAWNAAVQR